MEGLAGVIIAKRITLLNVIAQKAIPEGTVRYLQVSDNSINIFSWPTPNDIICSTGKCCNSINYTPYF